LRNLSHHGMVQHRVQALPVIDQSVHQTSVASNGKLDEVYLPRPW
jgi:hypothetical protein